MELVRAFRLTPKGKKTTLVNIARGNNLEIDGRKQVILQIQSREGLSEITTVEKYPDNPPIRHTYVATPAMLSKNHLYDTEQSRCQLSKEELRFCYRHINDKLVTL